MLSMSRSPFMPVRKRDGDGGHAGPSSSTATAAVLVDKDVMALSTSSNPGLGIGRPPPSSVQPLTSSALANWTASAANIQQHQHGQQAYHGHRQQQPRKHLTTALTDRVNRSAEVSSNVTSSPTSTSTSTTTTTSLLAQGKRYTRQLAPASPEDAPAASRSPALANMVSASDLRAKARVTSGSAPRRKPTVPGTEHADRGPSPYHSRPPQTPSAARAVSNGAAMFSASASSASRYHSRSISRTIPPIPAVPFSVIRPSSRAGHVLDHTVSHSRPASRMDDYGPDCIIRATPSSDNDSDECDAVSEIPKTPGQVLHAGSRRASFTASAMSPQSRQENVLVCVRVRPPAVGPALNNSRVNPAAAEEAWVADSASGSLRLADNLARSNEFHFDAVVTGSGNEIVYGEAARDLVGSAMQGYDAVIFAYGQTASGKTFTLSGNVANPGIIPQAVRDIFAYIRAHPQKEFLLRASYIEIYNEQLKDLLAPETVGQVKVRQDDKRRFFVSPLREEVVTNELHVVQLLERGEINRHTGQTDYNTHSSRSHTVFQIVIESRDVGSAAAAAARPHTPGFARLANSSDDRAVTSSRLSLIDLAGSEKATSQADRRMEGAFINKSLLTLEKVIAALTEKKAPAHIPYRDSKLTQILQPSLSGEARVSVICTINPSPLAIQESTTTLKFAQRVKKVTLHAEKNEIVGDKALLIRYEQTIAEMTAYIAQLESANGTTSAPSTPRQPRAGGEARADQKLNPEVRKAKEDMAKLQGYIVNAQNIDDARDVAPRPITPVKPARAVDLPFLQEQLLDAQDRIGELEEVQERQLDEIAALKAELASRPSSVDSGEVPSESALNVLRKRNEELEKQCREFRVILANEDTATALKSERRLAAREWSDKLLQLQNSLDRSKQIQQDALAQLSEERMKTARLERALLKRGSAADSTLLVIGQPPRSRRRSGSLDGLSSLSHESPMLSTTASYVNLDEVAHSPTATPTRLRVR